MMTMSGARQTYFVGSHREGVNVTLFRGFLVQIPEFLLNEQFRSHVAARANLDRHPVVCIHESGVGYYTCDLEVPQACITILADQDVSLERMDIGARLKRRTCSVLTGLTLPCITSHECRYSRPRAA